MTTTRMKTTGIAAAAALIAAAIVTPALAQEREHAPRCLWSRDIEATHTPNDHTIVFQMKNGRRWVSHVRGACMELATYGFNYVTPEDEICSGTAITVRRTGGGCELGPFEAVPMPHPQ